jgi:hypothetical protein
MTQPRLAVSYIVCCLLICPLAFINKGKLKQGFNMKHTDINLKRLIQRNPIFFNSKTIAFHKDKSYKIDNENRILTVNTAYGKVIYSVGKNLKLTWLSN